MGEWCDSEIPIGDDRAAGKGSLSMHAFVDETKQHGLLVVSTVVDVAHLHDARKQMQGCRMKGQNRIHFKKESDQRRRSICAVICELDVKVYVYDATRMARQAAARAACLTAAVEDLAALGARRLIIEQDDSLMESDRRALYAAVRKCGVDEELVYQHTRPNHEPILWVSDAVAWCVAKGGDWRRRVDPIITATRTIV